jgi:hypothetical protein
MQMPRRRPSVPAGLVPRAGPAPQTGLVPQAGLVRPPTPARRLILPGLQDPPGRARPGRRPDLEHLLPRDGLPEAAHV